MSSDSDDDAPVTAQEAGQHLFDYLVDLKLRNKLSAKDACILAYWAVMSGSASSSALKKLSKEPGDTSTGHYSDHFDRASGLARKDPDALPLLVPQYSKVEGCGVLRPLACKAPQLVLAEEAQSTPNFDRIVQDFAASLPRVYSEHPVVTASPRYVVPLAFFLDGVEYAKKGSVIGFF